jgi:uncharacterized protein (TIGR02001 family)
MATRRATSPPTALAATALLGLLSALPAGAAGVADDLSVYVGAVSDYVFRGYSQTRERPAVQLGLDYEHESGLFAGLWASNVEFAPAGPFEDPRDVEIDAYVGYGVELGRDWALSGTLVRYAYPGADDVIDWDYNELAVALRWSDAALAVAYSDSSLGSGEKGVAVELTDRWKLPWRLALLAGAGFYDLEASYLEDYVYWNLGLARPFGRFTLTLGYFDTDGRAEEVWGDRAAARLVAGATFRIH